MNLIYRSTCRPPCKCDGAGAKKHLLDPSFSHLLLKSIVLRIILTLHYFRLDCGVDTYGPLMPCTHSYTAKQDAFLFRFNLSEYWWYGLTWIITIWLPSFKISITVYPIRIRLFENILALNKDKGPRGFLKIWKIFNYDLGLALFFAYWLKEAVENV